jgi:hypothetical protein
VAHALPGGQKLLLLLHLILQRLPLRRGEEFLNLGEPLIVQFYDAEIPIEDRRRRGLPR